MNGFSGDLTIRKFDERYYTLVGFLRYENDEIAVQVNEGFLTDAASIPRAMWRLVGTPFTGKYTASAVIHDALYGSHLTTKEVADNLFLEMMEEEGVSWWKRQAMVKAVQWFGGSSWDKEEDKIRKVREYVQVTYNDGSDIDVVSTIGL